MARSTAADSVIDVTPPDASFEAAAVLLLAVETCLMDDYDSPDKALAFAQRIFASIEEEAVWADGKHCGDCTKQAVTCNRCVVERFRADARALWDADE